MNIKYERQLKKGILEILVLKLLSEADKYGYQLISEMDAKSNGMFKVKEGTLYPILYRLEDEGLVVSKWTEPKDREMSRKYYSITMSGIVVLDDMKNLWDRFSTNVENILSD
ncbi:MAG: PadR family transcriptional regulator [Lachnospira sp.]